MGRPHRTGGNGAPTLRVPRGWLMVADGGAVGVLGGEWGVGTTRPTRGAG